LPSPSNLVVFELVVHLRDRCIRIPVQYDIDAGKIT
jgi:hypothetical protein